jgi:4-hydroxybutyryl-CoA dehydratase/vinylacetyl-CoA-Delta-isomerase
VINAVAKTYEMALDPEYEHIATATSHLTGERISQWTHVPQSIEDLDKRALLNIEMSRQIGCCHYRCSGQEGLHVLASLTYEMDRQLGTGYHDRFRKYLEYVQENDMSIDACQTDAKGDRLKRPLEQADPDLHLRVVKRTNEGIVVRGAKLHQVGPMVAQEHIVFPPIVPLRRGEEEYAVCFVVPNGTEGITYICQDSPIEIERRYAKSVWHLGTPEYGSEFTAMVVFDDVFVPWERVFMCGEVEFTPFLLDKFVRVHNILCRGSCKVGNMDLLIGATQTIAEYNGIQDVPHVRDKITEIIRIRETTRACTIAAIQSAREDPLGSGVYFADSMFSMMGSINTQYGLPRAALLAADVAGGSVVTMPSEAELQSPNTGEYLRKYFKGVAGVSTEDRMRMFKFLQHWTAGSQGVLMWHSSGPIQVNRSMVYMLSKSQLEEKKKLAKRIAGIKNV